MEFLAVGKRCAVHLDSLKLPLTNEEALALIGRLGFAEVSVDLVELARSCVGTSVYRRGARFHEAPGVVDCSGFVRWLYGQMGIWLPRRSIQQYMLGEEAALEEVSALDVVFVSGRIDYYHDDPTKGVGHVGIATGLGTVVHAANKELGVIETPLAEFIEAEQGKFRGVRRYVPKGADLVTLQVPEYRDVDTSDDIRWIVLRSLHK